MANSPQACYLRVTGIPGSSGAPGREGWIPVTSFYTAMSAEPEPGIPAVRQDFGVTKNWDQASPLLNLACCEGWTLKEVVLEMCHPEGSQPKFLEIRLTNVRLLSCSLSGSPGSVPLLPVEQLAFRGEKIEWICPPEAFLTESGERRRAVKASWQAEDFKEPEETRRAIREE